MPINKYTNSERELFDNYSGEENAPVSGPSSILEKDQIVKDAPEQSPKYNFQKGPVRPRISPLESGTRGAIDAATMNYGDELYGFAFSLPGGKDPEEEAAYQRYMNQEAYSQNPGNYLTGSVAGSMGINAIPIMGPAVTAGRLMRGGVAAGKGAVEGFGSGDDLESRVSNAITGATVGGLAAGVAEPLARSAVQAVVPTSTGLYDKARFRAVKSVVGGQMKASRDLIPDYAEHGKRLLAPTEELGGKSVVQFGNNFAATAKLAEEARAGVGEKLGGAVDAMDKSIPWMNAETRKSLTNKLRGLPENLKLTKSEGDVGKPQKDVINKLIEQIKSSPNLEDLTRIKNGIIFDPQTEHFTVGRAKQKIRSAIGDALKDAADKSKNLMGKGMEPEKKLLENYSENSTKYRSFAPAAEYAEEGALRDAKNRGFGLSSNIIGASQLNGSVPGWGIVKGALAATINQLGINRGNSAMAVSFNSLAKVLDAFPEPMKKFYPMLLEASKRGGTSLAVTHAALLNKNPEYKQMIEGERINE